MCVNKRILIVTLIIIGLINSILFLLPIEKTVIFYLIDFFIMIAALIMLYSSMLAFNGKRDGDVARSRFYGWPIMRIGIIGFVLSLMFNIILIVAAQIVYVAPWIVIIANFILLSIIGIGLIGIDSSRNFVEEQRIHRDEQTRVIKELRMRSKQLADCCNTPELQSRLKHMAEEFRYSDPNSNIDADSVEAQIIGELDLLESLIENDIEKAYVHINKIESLLKKRNSIVLAKKH